MYLDNTLLLLPPTSLHMYTLFKGPDKRPSLHLGTEKGLAVLVCPARQGFAGRSGKTRQSSSAANVGGSKGKGFSTTWLGGSVRVWPLKNADVISSKALNSDGHRERPISGCVINVDLPPGSFPKDFSKLQNQHLLDIICFGTIFYLF